MTTGDWAFALVAVVAVIAAAICAVAWKVAYDDGRADGILHERNTRNERKIRQRNEEQDFGEWLRQLAEDDGYRLASTGELVILTGTNGMDGGPFTRPPRTALVSDTGAFRALTESTDAYLTRMAAEEQAYREGLSA